MVVLPRPQANGIARLWDGEIVIKCTIHVHVQYSHLYKVAYRHVHVAKTEAQKSTLYYSSRYVFEVGIAVNLVIIINSAHTTPTQYNLCSDQWGLE